MKCLWNYGLMAVLVGTPVPDEVSRMFTSPHMHKQLLGPTLTLFEA